MTYVPADLDVRFDLNELNERPMLTLLERKGVDIASCDQVITATLADGRLAGRWNDWWPGIAPTTINTMST